MFDKTIKTAQTVLLAVVAAALILIAVRLHQTDQDITVRLHQIDQDVDNAADFLQILSDAASK